MSAKRIVFTVATGRNSYAEQALGLARSLKFIGDTTPRVVMTDIPNPAFGKVFDLVLPPPKAISTYMLKLAAFEATDADEILFIDSDCVAFKRLDRIWEACRNADFAVQGKWISEGHWYGYLENILPNLGLTALPRFNGGMMFYRRTENTRRLIEQAVIEASGYQNTGLDMFRGTVPDEPCVALAMARTGVGTVLSETDDFMNTPVGVVGKLDIDIKRARCRFMKHSMHDLRLMEPTILHAGKFVNNAIYWKQLDILRQMELYEEKHGYGYMSPGHKLRRSLEKRVLQFRKKI
ncbi:hypothetical protein BH11ARM1_BH11ARM1_16050 [soil metagenome]